MRAFDELCNGVGNGVADVRHKLEEVMWGRAVTDGPGQLQWPEPQEPAASFGSSTHLREMEPQQDIDLDR